MSRLPSLFPAIAQVGTHRIPIFDDESVKQNVKAIAAADARRELHAAEILVQERKKREQVERDYAAERTAELDRIRQLPADAQDKQSQRDMFGCMYPPLENIPPKPQEVDACLKRIFYEQERVKQEALVEQRRLAAEQERIAEEALKVERKRIAEEQRRVEEAALRAAQEMPAAEVFLPFSLVGFLLQ